MILVAPGSRLDKSRDTNDAGLCRKMTSLADVFCNCWRVAAASAPCKRRARPCFARIVDNLPQHRLGAAGSSLSSGSLARSRGTPTLGLPGAEDAHSRADAVGSCPLRLLSQRSTPRDYCRQYLNIRIDRWPFTAYFSSKSRNVSTLLSSLPNQTFSEYPRNSRKRKTEQATD
ncbi:hypothetical protein D3C76_1369230 [compost metagenome]